MVLLESLAAHAGPGKFSYQGQIIKPDGQALESNSVSFKIEILSPSPELCVLYEESHTRNMTNSNGIFSLTIGEGTRPAGADYQDTTSIYDALDNSIGLVTPTDCVAGPTYTADASDGRKLRVTFDDGSGPVTLAQDHNIVSVPYAVSSSSVGGLTAADLLQIRDDASFQLNQSNLEFVFSNANWTELQALLDGSSSSFTAPAPTGDVDNNNQKIINLDDPNPATPTDAVNVRYANSYIGGQAVNAADLGALAPGNANEVLTWSGTEWISTGVPEDTDKLEKTGDTMSGTLNMGNQDITNVKDLTVNNDASVGNNLSVTAAATVGTSLTVTGGIGVGTGLNSAGPINLSNENEIQLAEATGNGTNYVGFKAPATLAGDVIWTLPDALGTNGQFLQTDAAGNLTWATVNAGVTDFNGRTGAITPLASDYDADQVDFDNTYGGNVAAVEVQAAIEELDGEKIAKAGDAMTGNLTMDLNTGVTTELRFQDTGTKYVGFKAPNVITEAASFVWTLPVADGDAGQVLQTSGAGVLSWVDQPSGYADATTDMIAGNGLTGGGDLSADRTFNIGAGNGITVNANDITVTAGNGISVDGTGVNVDITNETPEVTVNGADEVLIYDASVTALRKMTRTNFVLSETEVDSMVSNNGYLVDGGNTTGSAVVVGTNDAQSLELETNNSTAMTIDSAGNVGIGTSAPITTLHVNGPIYGSNGITSNQQFRFGDGSSLLSATTAGAGSFLVTEVNNTEVMRILASGNVGIGTSAPSATLDVNGSAFLTGDARTLSFSGSNTFIGELSNSKKLRLRGGGSDGGDTVYIDAEGRLGMGTSVPTAKFEIDDNAGGDEYMAISNAGTGDILIIDSSGKVGIGTSSPDTLLELAGTLKLADGSETCSAGADGGMIRYSGTDLQFCNGTSWQTLGISGAGITSLGGQTGGTQTFAVNASGTAPAINSATDTHTLSIPLASGAGVTSGTISKTDYDSFAGKLDAVAGESLNSAQFWVGDGTNAAAAVTMSGDATMTNAGVVTISESDPGLQTLTTAEVDQLENIDTETITNTQWSYLANMGGQPLESFTEADTLATVTGRGANTATSIQLDDEAAILFQDTTGTETASIKAPADIPASYVLTLPPDDGDNLDVLQTDGSGNLTWVPQTSGADDLGDHTATQNLDLADNSIINVNRGSASIPALSFDSDGNTGLFSPGPDLLSLATAGNEALTVDAAGEVGIGTSNPFHILHVESDSSRTYLGRTDSGNTTVNSLYLSRMNSGGVGGAGLGAGLAFRVETTVEGAVEQGGTIQSIITDPTNGALDTDVRIQVAENSTPREVLRATSSGSVGIGTTTPDTILEIAGTLKIADGSETCSAGADGGMIRYSGTDLQYCNGSSWQTLGISGAGITSLGGQTGGTQTFAVDASGTAPAINSAANTHTLSVPLASGAGVTSGTISKTDYDSFAGKLDAVAGESLNSAQFWVGDGTNAAAAVTMSGDATMTNAGVVTISESDPGLQTLTTAEVDQLENINTETITNTQWSYLANMGGQPLESFTEADTLATVTGRGANTATSIQMDDEAAILFQDTTGTETASIKAPADIPSSYVLTLPPDDGDNLEVLQTDGSGNLTWVAQSSGSDDLGDHTATQNLDLADNLIINANRGTAAAPSLSFDSDTNTGLFSPGPDLLSLTTAGSEALSIDASGNVGIGTTVPTRTLDVDGSINALSYYQGGNLIDFYYLAVDVPTTGGATKSILQSATDAATAPRGPLLLRNNGTGGANELNLVGQNASGTYTSWIGQEGNAHFANSVGIGTTAPATILEIDGTLKIADGSEACSAGADGGMIRYSGGNLQFCNGSAWQTLGVSGAGLTSLGGQTGNTQTFAVNASGTAPAINSATDTHTLSIPLASGAGVTSGTISKTDYDSFAGKLDAVAGESLSSAQFWVGDGTNAAAAVTMSGDATMTNAGVVTISESDPGLQTLTTAEVDQLENINTETITNTQWSYLANMGGQPLESFTEADTLATVTGRGANTATSIQMDDEAAILFQDTTGTETASIKAPADIPASYVLTLPPDDGDNLEVLQTDGSGNLTWVAQSSGADDLGDHTATANIELNDNWLSNDGGAEGIRIDNTGNVGIGTTAPGARIHSISTSEQLRLGYDAANYLSVSVESDGITTFDTTGSYIQANSELVLQGGFRTHTNGAQANFAVRTPGGLSTEANGRLQLLGSSNINTRVYENGVDATLSVGLPYSAHVIGSQAVTEGASGNHPLLSQLAIRPFQVTDGVATVSDTATLYIEDSGSAVTSGSNYALWIDDGVSRFDGSVGIGTTNPAADLDVVGDISYTGTLTDASDRRLKTDIKDLEDPLATILALDGVSFRMKNISTQRVEYGFIAQDVEEVLPELVHTQDNEMETKSVNYIGLIGWLVEAMKELAHQVTSYQSENTKKITELEDMIQAQNQKINKLMEANEKMAERLENKQ